MIDALSQPAETLAFARRLEEECHKRVCPDGEHYIRGYFDTGADAILTAYLMGFSAGAREASRFGAPNEQDSARELAIEAGEHNRP